jgi:hypothetical protein
MSFKIKRKRSKGTMDAGKKEIKLVSQPTVELGGETLPLTLGLNAFAYIAEAGYMLTDFDRKIRGWSDKVGPDGQRIPGTHAVDLAFVRLVLVSALRHVRPVDWLENALNQVRLVDIAKYQDAINRAVSISCGTARIEEAPAAVIAPPAGSKNKEVM